MRRMSSSRVEIAGTTRWSAGLFTLACALSAAAPAQAQEASPTGDAPPPVAPPTQTVEGPKTYTPADFARFAPRTALDMVQQVPGFAIRQATQERGLGEATGNVLINGQRTSGKSNDAVTELGRISARNVIRIEIVDGATLSIPGLSGQVANVIVKSSSKITGQYSWSPEFRLYNTDPVLARGQVSVTGKTGPVDYTLGLQLQGGNGGADGPTFIYGPDLEFVERRYDQFAGRFVSPQVSGRFTFDGPGTSVGNLNLSYRRGYFDNLETGFRSGPGRVDRNRRVTVRDRGYEYEMGGDFEFGFGPGRLKLIALNRYDNSPFTQDVITSFADQRPRSGIRISQVANRSERIGRAEYRFKTGKSDWQISGEGAFNSLDNVSKLFDLRPDGEFREVPFPGSTARVEEDRYEVVGSFGRPLSPTLSIQLSAGGEYSNLRQVGGGGLSRTFYRPKGLVSVAWKATPRLDVNVKLQRKVGQLNFSDFLATVNLIDDRENAGNPDLVPQQSWELDMEAVKNMGRYGSATLRLYGRLIDDIVDIVPIGETGESPGNIDRATIMGIEAKTTFNFDPLGWKGAKLDARVQAARSRLEDPLTGEQRPISSSLFHLVELSLRHDIPRSDWAYGGSANYQRNSLYYRLTELGRQYEGPVFASVFVENKDVLGLTVRAAIANILDATSILNRTVYVGRRTGPVAFFERRDRRIGPIFSFSVKGKF
jgi:hypothetical protein